MSTGLGVRKRAPHYMAERFRRIVYRMTLPFRAIAIAIVFTLWRMITGLRLNKFGWGNNMSESTDKPQVLPCPRCNSARYQKRDLAWLGVEIMLCPNCGYADRVPAKADPRVAHDADNREAKPL